jgi:hypothetical protein
MDLRSKLIEDHRVEAGGRAMLARSTFVTVLALLFGAAGSLLGGPARADSGVSNVTTVDQVPLATGCVAPVVGYVSSIGGEEYAKACPIGDNRFRYWCSNGTVFDFDQYSSDPVPQKDYCVAPYGTFSSKYTLLPPRLKPSISAQLIEIVARGSMKAP